MNQFHANGVIFGREVVFVYGPLSYLILPMPFGRNLEEGIAFQLLVQAAFAATLAFLLKQRKIALPNLLVITACALPASRILHEFEYAGPDFFLEFLAVFWLACALQVHRAFCYLAAGIVVLLGFIKISSAIGAFAAGLILPLLLFLGGGSELRRGASAWLAMQACRLRSCFCFACMQAAGQRQAAILGLLLNWRRVTARR